MNKKDNKEVQINFIMVLVVIGILSILFIILINNNSVSTESIKVKRIDTVVIEKHDTIIKEKIKPIYIQKKQTNFPIIYPATPIIYHINYD